jgi:hypothetical protein
MVQEAAVKLGNKTVVAGRMVEGRVWTIAENT